MISLGLWYSIRSGYKFTGCAADRLSQQSDSTTYIATTDITLVDSYSVTVRVHMYTLCVANVILEMFMHFSRYFFTSTCVTMFVG